jgi:hypothetical protein
MLSFPPFFFELYRGEMMKKSMLMSLMFLAVGAVYGADGDTTNTMSAAPQGPTVEEGLANVKGALDGLNETFLETKATVDKLAKIKLSGYIQAQWQYADSVGIQSVAGGNFPGKFVNGATVQNAVGARQRFLVRRGRLKTTYETPTSRYVLQFDVIPAGVSIKDAYLTVMEPWLNTFSYTMGVFDRPFGYEISYSSSSRESPERSRVYQVLFPGERDMGAKLEINPGANMGIAQYFNFKGGVFTGMGPTTNEIDDEQDIIGRLGFKLPFYDLNLAIDGGFSANIGKVKSIVDIAYAIDDTIPGVKSWVANKGNAGKSVDRNIMGVDAQVYYDLPVIGGFAIRGEYIWGNQPTTRTSTNVFSGTPAASATTPTPSTPQAADREVMGWYVNFVQNLGTKVQAVVKYDMFDPNTKVKGKDVGAAKESNLAPADLAIATLGLGGIFHWDENVKFVAYYDMVTNEKANSAAVGSNAANTAALAPWKKDLNDNVFTFRVQVKLFRRLLK